MTISIPRPLTVSEATAAFEDAADRHDTLTCFIHQDVAAIQAMADILARACGALGLLFSRLDKVPMLHFRHILSVKVCHWRRY